MQRKQTPKFTNGKTENRSTKNTRKKKTERQRLDAECLRIWSLCVRARDLTCRNCNSSGSLQAHHIVQRNYKASRYLLDNGICLCAGCHWPEKLDPEKFRGVVISIIGEAKYLYMQETYRINYKYTIDDLIEIKEELKSELTRLRGE